MTRVRFMATKTCSVSVAGGDVTLLRQQNMSGPVTVTATSGFIDTILLAAPTAVGLRDLCVDAGPFGWRRWEQWKWSRSVASVTENLYRSDPVLAPGAYRLAVQTGVKIDGADPKTELEPLRTADFTVGPPPGLLTPTGTAEADRNYPHGGSLSELEPYVDYTVPRAGELPVYRTYDVGIQFRESYVSRMFLAAQAGLTVAVVDANGTDRRADATNVWGEGPEVRLGRSDEQWVKTLNGDGVARCATIDLGKVVRDEGVRSGAGEPLEPAAIHRAELRAAGQAAVPFAFSFVTSRFADFRQQLATFDGRCRELTVGTLTSLDVATLLKPMTAAEQALASAVSAHAAARTPATTGTPTVTQLKAYAVARVAVTAARSGLAAASAAAFDALWNATSSEPEPALLAPGVELSSLRGGGSGATSADLLLLESPEPVRVERLAPPVLERSSTVPIRRRAPSPLDVGAPDKGATVVLDGVALTTDAELWVRDGTLRQRMPGPWNLTLRAPRASRVRLGVTVAAGGTATLTGAGTNVSATATSGPTSGPVTLEVTGALTSAVLSGTGVALVTVQVDEPFAPVVADGPLRIARMRLPASAGDLGHSVDLVAMSGVELAGWRITWQDATDPGVQGTYHAFAPGTRVADGRVVRVYGGLATPAADVGVDLYAGGTTGALPVGGVILQLIDPALRVRQEWVALPVSSFTATAGPRLVANGDQTRLFAVAAAGAFTPGWWRLRLSYQRAGLAELPDLSVGGDTTAEEAVLGFRIDG